MKQFYCLVSLAILACACSVNEPEETVVNNYTYPAEISACIDDSATPDSKVYADENLKVLWNHDDRISLFNKYTYNKEYYFFNETGANAGVFKEVTTGEIITGNELDYVYGVYPYSDQTTISNSGVISLNLPGEQAYGNGTFGLGANTMVSATTNTELLFKNLCGYLILKLYGDNVDVSSIILHGNNHEVLSGPATVTATVGDTPTFAFAGSGTSETITLNCTTPVHLGTSASDATVFWLVVPPTTFSQGFTITVKDPYGKTFSKSTTKSVTVSRNATYRMGALEALMTAPQPNNVIYYTSTNNGIISPTEDQLYNYSTQQYDITTIQDKFGANIVSNEYVNGQGIITFDGDVTVIGLQAFMGFANLSSISIPNSVTSIGGSAFFNCTSLSSITIPDGVTSIGGYAFNGCTCLSSITIPNGVTSIGVCAFKGCTGLSSISIPNSVTSIGDSAFKGCTGLTSIILPNGLTSIGNGTFQNCADLSTITIPNGVTSIGGSAFKSCTSLTSITLSSGLTSIGEYAFEDCSNLSSITIPDGVTTIGVYAFYHCSAINSIVIPGSATTFDFAFIECSGLESVVFNNGVTSIGNYAFYGCTSLTSIILPNGLTSIGEYAFNNTNLSAITFPSSLTSIGRNAFACCSGLTSITLPSGLTSIGSAAFGQCTNLSSITIPEGLTSIGGFSNCTALTSIIIPDGVLSIEQSAFSSCTSLSSIALPNSLTSIGVSAFRKCSMSTITIPDGVTSIGYLAFSACNNMTSITLLPSTPPSLEDKAFEDNSCDIYVPAGSVNAYKTADGWIDLADRIYPIP